MQDLSDARDVLKQELNDRAQNEGVVVTKLKKKVEELEEKCNKLSEESENAKEKLVAHDGAAKRAITALQKEMTLRVDQVIPYLSQEDFFPSGTKLFSSFSLLIHT